MKSSFRLDVVCGNMTHEYGIGVKRRKTYDSENGTRELIVCHASKAYSVKSIPHYCINLS